MSIFSVKFYPRASSNGHFIFPIISSSLQE